MKKLSTFLLLLPFTVCCQVITKDPSSLLAREFTLAAQSSSPESVQLPFQAIKIIDSRFDTSKAGFVLAKKIYRANTNSFRRMTLTGGVQSSIEKYYNDYYKPAFINNGFELLIVMKKFWVTAIPRQKNKLDYMLSSKTLTSDISVKWEYYLGKNGYYLPVKRVDTVWQHSEDLEKYIEQEFEEKNLSYLKFILKAQIEMLDFSAAILAFDAQPKKTWAMIKEFNDKRLNLPVLQDSGFSKGVFVSFEEFKSNKPSIPEFKEKKTRYGWINTESYIQYPDGSDIVKYWGYFNGKIFRYGRIGNEKLYRCGHTFELFIPVMWLTQSSSGGFNRQEEIWVPYQVDMETGQVY